MPPNESKSKTNTLAIVGFILSFFTGVIGIVLSAVAYAQIRKTGEGGKGLALAGIILGSILTIVGVIVAVAVSTAVIDTNSKIDQYNDGITALNKVIESYNSMLTSKTNSVDPSDTTAFKKATGEDAANYKQSMSQLTSRIEQLGKSQVFTQDTKAKRLYNNLDTKFTKFDTSMKELITLYEDTAAGKTVNAQRLSGARLAISTNDINTDLNKLSSYLVSQANSLAGK
ncbi:DUF4190 domain-containing protein [Candidatus Saccharibacteria bacterium]|nr:DUF4190 domain-containing protein [Candidatus Saccharibacteria bacterium]